MNEYTLLSKFNNNPAGDYNVLEIYDNRGVISVLIDTGDCDYEVYLSAEDEEKLRVLLNKRKENKL